MVGTNANQATRLLEVFQRDLLDLIQRDPYGQMPHIVITGLLELAGHMMRGGVVLEPSALPTLLGQIDRLREHVLTPAEDVTAGLRMH
jgi:hypothetical protein